MRVRIGSRRPSSQGRAFNAGKLDYRYGAATVEFAIILPVIVTLLLGAMEFSRAIMVKEILQDAVRKACRTGIQPGKDNAAITADVRSILSDNKIDSTSATITIMVNGVVADASTAKRRDQVSVKVSIPVSKVYWTTTIFLSGTDVESETVAMMRQG